MEAFDTFAEELETFFGELTMKQLNKEDMPEAAAAPEGEESKEQEQVEGSKSEAEAVSEKEPIHYGKRLLVTTPVEYDFKFLCDNSKTKVPEPLFPDPDKEPLPPPVTH